MEETVPFERMRTGQAGEGPDRKKGIRVLLRRSELQSIPTRLIDSVSEWPCNEERPILSMKTYPSSCG